MSIELPSDRDIEQRVRQAVADLLRMSIDDIAPDAKLGQELGMESLDYIDLQFHLETEFGVEFYPGSAVERLFELLAPAQLEEDDLLTQLGASVLQLRLPEVDSQRLREGEPTGIEAMFTCKTFVRTVKELLEARPGRCPHCESTDLDAVRASSLTCKSCKRELICPDGEACLTAWARTVQTRLADLKVPSGG